MRTLSLEGVRCFGQEQRLPIRPVTLLVGENSTGKSTVLAMIAGRAVQVAHDAVDADAASLRGGEHCASDDEHLVALARISGARVVCTEDAALMSDVRNGALVSKPRGRVYRTADHMDLLHHDVGCQRPPAKKRLPKRG